MSKQYGLIVPGKDKPKLSAPIARPSVFNSDSDEEPPQRPTGLKRALKQQDKLNQERAVEQDPTVYQYDEIYDEMDRKRKESKLSRKDLDKKPKYICKLLETAEKRKRENERRIERQVQKEREAEGDEFKEKESFVTSSYRKKLEELKELEEAEKREEYLESIGDVKKQGNLDGFYRHIYSQKVNFEDTEDIQKVEIKQEEVEKSDSPPKRKCYRKREDSAELSGEEKEPENVPGTSAPQHLPSNLDADSDFSIDSSSSDSENDEKSIAKDVKQEKNPETVVKSVKSEPTHVGAEVTQPVIQPPEIKVTEPVEKKPKLDIWRKRTVGEVYDAALQRYFERKSLREL